MPDIAYHIISGIVFIIGALSISLLPLPRIFHAFTFVFVLASIFASYYLSRSDPTITSDGTIGTAIANGSYAKTLWGIAQAGFWAIMIFGVIQRVTELARVHSDKANENRE